MAATEASSRRRDAIKTVQNTRRSLPAPRSDFIGLGDRLYFASGGEPPLLVAHRQAFERYASDKSDGFAGYHRHWDVVAGVRAKLANLCASTADSVALVGNASDAIDRVVSSIDWRAGDNVVVPSLDYASGRYALANLRERGVSLRMVREDGWYLDPQKLIDTCDERTRLIYLAQVNALTGQHHDMDRLWQAILPTDTILLVDASHALGAVPVRADRCDFLVSACYKFVLGVQQGLLFWNRKRRPHFCPAGVGWWSATPGTGPGEFQIKDDARRAEYGNVDHLAAYLLDASIDYLTSFGIAAIAAHARRLGKPMIDAIEALGLELMTPKLTNERGPNVAFRMAAPEDVTRRAAEQGVLVWGDLGRVRLSNHLFTSDEDVAALIKKLPGILA